jgi:hypothetical protein
MTVCIAALCDNRESLIMVSDKMITNNSGAMSYEYESQCVSKIQELIANELYILTAGSVISAEQIINRSRGSICADTKTPFAQKADFIAHCYQTYRREHISKIVLEPRGLDLNSYFANQKNLIPQMVSDIDRAFIQLNLNTELIIAGKCKTDEKYHISVIGHPGINASLDSIGYAVIGSGAPHANYALIGSSYNISKSYDEILKDCKTAKQWAQRAPGVGQETLQIGIKKGVKQ